MNKTLQKAVRAEYAMLRTPLNFLDEHVLARLRDHAMLRGAVERSVSTLQAAAGRLRPHESPPQGKPPAVRPEEVAERADALLAEEESHPLAGELAEGEQLRRVQAELKAKHQLEQEHGRDGTSRG